MATRRSRIQIKPNTSRGGSEASAKPAPAAPRPAIASPRKSGSTKQPDAVQASPKDSPSTETPLPERCEVTVEPEISPTPATRSPVRGEPPPPVAREEVPAKPSAVGTVSEAQGNKPKQKPPVGKGRGRPRVSKPQPNLRQASARVARRRSVEAVEVEEEEQDAVHSEPNGTVEDVTNGERQPEECPPSPPPRHASKASTEKRARKENRELQGRKRRHYRPGGKGPPPDRGSMTMMDLIYYNPPGNPMPEKAPKATVVEEVVEENTPQEREEETAVEEESIGPRVRVGPDGEITIDEESLVIRREPVKEDSRAVVYETGTETHYGSFRKRPLGRRLWSAKETARFYRALSVCGTDFTLMSTFFPKRSRQDLKNKFKREERFNRELVDKAINDPTQFDTVGLEDEEEDDEDVDDPDHVREDHRRSSTAPPKRRRGRPPKKPSRGKEVTVEEMDVVEDPTADNVVPIYEDERSETPPPSATPAACTAPMSTPARGSVPQGQLVFYASHAQEQVVHVFVVSPQANVSTSELVARLGTPPLSQRTTPTRTPARAVGSPSGGASADEQSERSPSTLLKSPTAQSWSLLTDGITPLTKLSTPQRQQLQSDDGQESPGTSGKFRAAGILPKGITPLAEMSTTP